MSQTTLNNVISAFSTFCTNHKQINTFYSGKTWNFQSEAMNYYPAMICLPNPSEIGSGYMNLSFSIFVCDILNQDRSNLDDIYSDTLQICGDFVSYFKDSEDTLGFTVDNTTVNAEPFEESFDDVLAGFMLTVNVIFPFRGSICVIPI